MDNLKSLFEAWSAADRTFTSAIQNAFPKLWPGDVRYTAKAKGDEGSALRIAYDGLQVARKSFYDAGGADWLRGSGTGRPPIAPDAA